MKINDRCTCQETCNQEKPCGNIHCSAHPNYIQPVPEKESQIKQAKKRHFNALHPRKKHGGIYKMH